ncbi:MAG TPA: dihydrolipoamide acetyltransferase family protein [Conexibacter sp.]|nr:dihydrolipoamide acetyltransferase family protein [Conexibacter sp.]
MADVVMPRLSDSMEEGTILRWLVDDGAEVARGQEIAEIETDKANMTYEADTAGTFERVAGEGDTLPIGALIARIGGTDASAPEPPAELQAGPVAARGDSAAEPRESSSPAPPARSASAAPAEEAASAARPAAPSPSMPAVGERSAEPATPRGNGRVKASPIARRLARERGVDLAALTGTGPGGRIVKADVEAAAAPSPAAAPAPAPTTAPAAPEPAAPPAPVPGPVLPGERGGGKGETTVEELSRTQQTIARRMAEAKATVPDFHVSTEVDMAAAVAVREQLKALATDEHPAPSYNDFVVKAAALALREFPRANGAYKDGRFERYERVNVGVAVAAPDALIVPTIFDADEKSVGEIALEARALAARVRSGAITPPELSGGTFTVSNLGMFGVTEFTAIVNGGQAGILAVGALRETPVVVDGAVVPGRRMTLTLVADHRILYGADAARLLARIRELLESPLSLAL